MTSHTDDDVTHARAADLKALFDDLLEAFLLLLRHARLFDHLLKDVDLLASLRHGALVLGRQTTGNRLQCKGKNSGISKKK